MRNEVFNKYLYPSKKIYLLLYLIYIIPLYIFDYIPSLDSGQHSLTTNILNNLIFNNTSGVTIFYQITEFPVGYWTTHLLYAVLQNYFPGNIAEKFLMSTYFILFAQSSWYLTSQVTKRPTWLIVIFFPFANHMFFSMGYYPFSFGFIGLFFVIGYTIKIINTINTKKALILSLYLLILYFTHGIVFSIGLFIVTLLFIIYSTKESYKKNIVYFLISAVPSGLFMVFYILWISKLSGTKTIPYDIAFIDLLKDFFRLRLLTVFHHQRELKSGLIIGIPLFGILLLYLWNIVKANKLQLLWFGLFLFFFIVYLFIPNLFLTGSLVNRIGLISIILLILFLNTNNSIIKWNKISYIYLFIAIIIVFGTIQKKIIHNSFIKDISNNVKTIKLLEPYIKNNDIVLGINESRNWTEIHLLCYLGDEKMINYINNPQLGGQFPLRWNKNSPYYTLGPNYLGRNSYIYFNNTYKNFNSDCSFKIIDHIVIWKYQHFFDSSDQKNNNILKYIKPYYDEIYVTPDNKAAIYSLRSNNEIKDRLFRINNSPEWKNNVEIKAKKNGIPYELQAIKDAYSLGIN